MNNKIITDSGLEMLITQTGSGNKPKIGQTIAIHYTIWLSNESFSSNFYYVGEEGAEKYAKLVTPDYIDEIPKDQLVVTTYGEDVVNNEMKRPRDYKLLEEELIEFDKISGRELNWLLPKGLKEALLDMNEGDKRILNIPPELGYGKSGASSFRSFFRYRVPPYSWMRCEIELVKVYSEEEVKKFAKAKFRVKKRAEDMQVQDKGQNTPN